MIFQTSRLGGICFLRSLEGFVGWTHFLPTKNGVNERVGSSTRINLKNGGAGHDWEDGSNQENSDQENHRKDETLKRGKSWDELPIYINWWSQDFWMPWTVSWRSSLGKVTHG